MPTAVVPIAVDGLQAPPEQYRNVTSRTPDAPSVTSAESDAPSRTAEPFAGAPSVNALGAVESAMMSKLASAESRPAPFVECTVCVPEPLLAPSKVTESEPPVCDVPANPASAENE